MYTALGSVETQSEVPVLPPVGETGVTKTKRPSPTSASGDTRHAGKASSVRGGHQGLDAMLDLGNM